MLTLRVPLAVRTHELVAPVIARKRCDQDILDHCAESMQIDHRLLLRLRGENAASGQVRNWEVRGVYGHLPAQIRDDATVRQVARSVNRLSSDLETKDIV